MASESEPIVDIEPAPPDEVREALLAQLARGLASDDRQNAWWRAGLSELADPDSLERDH